MRLTIMRDENTVSIDGRITTVDCSELPDDIRSVNWYDDHGEKEYKSGVTISISGVEDYRALIDAANGLSKTL